MIKRQFEEFLLTTTLLHLDCSILGANSVSRDLSASIVSKLRSGPNELHVNYRDLVAQPIPHLSAAHVAAGQIGEIEHDPLLQAELTLGSDVLEEFLDAEIVVLGFGFYNFGVPSQLKAWIDRLAIVGRTFRYTSAGPIGLAGSKRVILAIARGGLYGAGSASEALEHAESYLRTVFGFFGISEIEAVVAEGLAVGPEAKAKGLAVAKAQIAALKM